MRTAARATAAPARSMRISTGSGAAASIAFISSGVTTGITVSISQGNNHGLGGALRVGERDPPTGHAAVFRQRRGRAGDDERGRAGPVVACDSDVVKRERAEPDAEGLHRRLLGG